MTLIEVSPMTMRRLLLCLKVSRNQTALNRDLDEIRENLDMLAQSIVEMRSRVEDLADLVNARNNHRGG